MPDRDTQARFRFGHDPGAAAAAYLALAAWHLGEVERARRLVEQAVQLAAELGHVPTMRHAHALQMLLADPARDDPGAALRSAEGSLAGSRGAGMRTICRSVPGLCGWARGRLYDAQLELRSLRQALASYLNQGTNGSRRHFTGLLAELEARRGAPIARWRASTRLGYRERDREHCLGPFPPSAPRRNPAEAQSRRSRTRRGSLSGPQSRSRSSRARAAYELLASFRSPSSINRPLAPPTPTPSSRRRSKAFRRRRKCPRSPKRRRCWRRSRRPTRSRPMRRSGSD